MIIKCPDCGCLEYNTPPELQASWKEQGMELRECKDCKKRYSSLIDGKLSWREMFSRGVD